MTEREAERPGLEERSVPVAPRRRLRSLATWVLPYVLAGLVIWFLTTRYSISAIRAEMRKGNSGPLVPLALVTYVVSLAFVSWADTTVLRGLLGKTAAPGYFVMAKGKAASVVLHIVHYALGQGVYATWLARRTGLSLGRAGGLLLYVVAAELGSVCLYATLVILVGRPDVPGAVLPTAATIALALAAFLLVVPSTRLERVGFLHAWAKVGRRRGVAQLGIRLLQHATTTGSTWLAATWFGLEIPLGVMLSYMPVILVVASLPINVAGFGAVQGAWLLLSPWAPPERILAFSVVWQAVSGLALIVRGAPFLRSVLGDIRRGGTPLTPS